MRRWLPVSILVLCLAAPGVWAAGARKDDGASHGLVAPTWRIVPEKSSLTFTASQLGQAFTGKFSKFTADLTLDPADTTNATLNATVDLSAIDAGDKQRNEALPGGDWFDVAGHPKATFKSHKIVEKAGRGFEATGMMTIKGVQRQVTIPFTLMPTGDTAAIKGGFTLRRTDFGVGEGQWATDQWIGLDVKLAIVAVAVKR